jgi:hypothetical protein
MATRGSSDHRDGIAEDHALVVAGANNMKMFGMPSDLFLRYDNNRRNEAAIGASTSSFAQEYDNFESQPGATLGRIRLQEEKLMGLLSQQLMIHCKFVDRELKFLAMRASFCNNPTGLKHMTEAAK